MSRLNMRSLSWFLMLGLGLTETEGADCVCKLLDRPDLHQKEETARWMVHSLDWGVLSTISTRLDLNGQPFPFGNIYSFVDGLCDNSTGIPYLYGTYMDQSFIDSLQNKAVSLTLSEASLTSVCGGSNLKGCKVSPSGFGDPENPICARLVLSGTFEIVEEERELEFARSALFERHSSMQDWPDDHKWLVAKIEIQDLWLIDFFGGASILDVDKYKAVKLNSISAKPIL